MKTILKYHSIFLCAALMGLCLIMGCEKQEKEDPVPGTNTQLKTPQDLSTKVMGTTVQLVWRAQSEASSFTLQVSDNDAFGNPQVITTTASSYTLEALAVKTGYRARVQAIAVVESYNSEWSDAISFTTGDENILKATPKELSDRTLTLQWTPGAAVTHFTATPDGGEALPQQNISDNEKELGEATLTGLAPGTLYNVKLYNGANLRGEGEYTTLPLIMEDLALTLVNAAPDSLNLAWDDGEQVTHFVVTPEPVEGGATITAVTGDTAITVRYLLPATEYAVASFYNNSTRGVQMFTTAGILENVTVSAQNITATAAVIGWTGGDKYVSQLVFTSAVPAVAVTEADAAGKEVTGLTADTEYMVSLVYVAGGTTYTRGTHTFHTRPSTGAVTTHVPADATLSEYLAAAATTDTLVLDGTDYTLDNYVLRPNVTVTIRGGNPSVRSKLANSGTGVVFTLATDASLRLENIEFDGGRTGASGTTTGSGGKDYVINHSVTATQFNDIWFENCYIHHFGRSVVRVNGDEISIRSVTFNNCLFEALGDNGNYAIVHNTSGTNRSIANVTATNSTFVNVWGNVFYNQSGTPETFAIANCTFYDVWNHQNQGFLRSTSGAPATSTVTGIIVGNVKKNDATVRLFDVGTANVAPTVSGDNYKTSTDCSLAANYVIGFTDYGGTAADLFTDPANGDFSIKDNNFAGKNTAGDPRWRGGSGGGGGGGGEDQWWNFSDAAFTSVLPTGSLTEEYTISGLTITASSEKTMSFTTSNKSMDGYSFTHRLQLGGTGNTTERVLKFNVTGAATITVYLLSGSNNSSRDLIVHDGTSEVGKITATGSTELGSATDKGSVNYTGGTGSVYIYSGSSGINLYGIKVEY